MAGAAAHRYAKSLLELAREQGVLDGVKSDVDDVRTTLDASKELRLLLKSPIVKADKKAAILRTIFESSVHDLLLRFILLLTRKGREGRMAEILDAFIDRYNDLKGIQRVTVHTATALSDGALNDIRTLAGTALKGKEVVMESDVDPELIGGFVLRYEDKLLDASVRRQLEIIRNELTNA